VSTGLRIQTAWSNDETNVVLTVDSARLPVDARSRRCRHAPSALPIAQATSRPESFPASEHVSKCIGDKIL
jgi:hypothetical protein